MATIYWVFLEQGSTPIIKAEYKKYSI